MRWTRSALALITLAATAACGDDGTGPDPDVDQATIQGRVEQVAPEGAGYAAARSVTAGASAAVGVETVTAAQVESDGTLTALAQADVKADGSFSIDEVPVDRENLVVVAKNESDETVGRVMVHAKTEANTVITTEPINYETSVRALAYSSLRASGDADMSSSAELALLVRPDASAAATIMAEQEVDAMAMAAANAGDAMTRVYAGVGTALDASARAQATAEAAARFAIDRFNEVDAEAAFDSYADAALDAYVDAGAELESVVTATAAAASTFDAQLDGKSSVRGNLISDAVRLNLMAREKLAAEFQSGDQGSVALSIAHLLSEADAGVRGAATATGIREALDVGATAAVSATVDAMLDFLVPGGTVLVRSEVEAKAQEAVAAARLDGRLSAAATAEAAAEAVAEYRAEVKAAVQAMLDAAERTDLDVEVMTSLYIAAHGGAYVRTN
jgi:hypothetical protein